MSVVKVEGWVIQEYGLKASLFANSKDSDAVVESVASERIPLDDYGISFNRFQISSLLFPMFPLDEYPSPVYQKVRDEGLSPRDLDVLFVVDVEGIQQVRHQLMKACLAPMPP